MGKRGPKRLPTSVLKLRDSPLAQTRETDPDPTPVETIKPPAHLSREARRVFRSQEKALRQAGRLIPGSGPMLAVWCEGVIDYKQAQQAVEGLTQRVYSMPNGCEAPRPELKILDDSFKRLVKISEKLGLFKDAAPKPKAEPEEATGKARFFDRKFGNDNYGF